MKEVKKKRKEGGNVGWQKGQTVHVRTKRHYLKASQARP